MPRQKTVHYTPLAVPEQYDALSPIGPAGWRGAYDVANTCPIPYSVQPFFCGRTHVPMR